MKKIIFYTSIFMILVFSLVSTLSSQIGEELLEDDSGKEIAVEFGDESRIIKEKNDKTIFLDKSANLDKIIGFGNVTKVKFYKNKYGEEEQNIIVDDVDIEEVEDKNANDGNSATNEGENTNNSNIGGMSRSDSLDTSNDDAQSKSGQRRYLLAVGTSIGLELYSCKPSTTGGSSPYSGSMEYTLKYRYIANASVSDFCFSGDGKLLALALSNGEIREISLEDNSSIMRGTHGNLATAITYTVDGTLITGGSDNSVKVWEGSKAWILVQHKDLITSLDSSPDGKYIISGSRDTEIKYTYMDTATTKVLSKHNNWVTDVTFTPDGKYVMSVGADKLINRYNMTNDQILYRGVHRNWVNDIDITSDSKYTVTGDDNGRIYSWEYEVYGDNTFFKIGDYSKPISSLSLSPDDKWLALSSGGTEVAFVNIENVISKSADDEANMYDASTKISHYTDVIYAMDVSYKDKYMLTGHPNGDVILWNEKDGTFSKIAGHKGPVYDVDISDDLSLMASVGGDETGFDEGVFAGEIILWREGEERLLKVSQKTSEFYSVTISPDSKMLAAGAYGWVYLWDLETHQKKMIDLGKMALVNALKFDRKSLKLAVGLTDGTLILIDTEGEDETQRHLNKISGVINSLEFSLSNEYIYSSSQDGSLVRWNMRTGQKYTVASREANIIDFAYNSDESSYILLGVENKVVGINLRNKENIINNFIITKHKDYIANIHRTKDDFKVFSSGDDGIIKVSDLRKRSYYHNNTFFDLTLDIQETKDRLKWRNTEISNKLSNFMFQDDKNIYLMTGQRTIHAVNKKTHRVLWTREFEQVILSTPVVTRTKIVCSSPTGDFIILDKESGEIETIKLISGAATSDKNSYYVDADNIYFCTQGTGIFYGINVSTKNIFLDYKIPGNFACTPVGDRRMVYAIDEGGTAYAFRKSDHQLVWKQKTVTQKEKDAGKPSGLFRITKPLLFNNKIIFGSSATLKATTSIIVALDVDTGEREWLEVYGGTNAWPVKDNYGNGYFVTKTDIVKVNLNTGSISTPINIHTTEISKNTSLGIYKDNLYLTDLESDYLIRCFDIISGEQKWEFYRQGYESYDIPLVDEEERLIYMNTYDKSEKRTVLMALNTSVGGVITKTFRIEEED